MTRCIVALLEQRRQGLYVRDLAELFGVSTGTVSNICIAAGLGQRREKKGVR